MNKIDLVTKEQLFRDLFNESVPDDLVKLLSRVILVQVFNPPEKGFSSPESFKDGSRFDNRIGRVLDIGPHSYSDPDYFPDGPICSIGEWVMFWRHDASFMTMNKVDCALVPANKILLSTKKPQSINTAYFLGK